MNLFNNNFLYISILTDTKQSPVASTSSDLCTSKWSVLYVENRKCESFIYNLNRENSLQICSKSPAKKQEGVQQMILKNKPNNKNTCDDSDNFARRVRNRVGFGIHLMVDANRDIWLYNRSQIPVFVRSFTASINKTDSVTKLDDDILKEPFKIFPGHMSKVFDHRAYERLSLELQSQSSTVKENISSMIQQHFLKDCNFMLSFGKGFGKAYENAEIINCPCWVQFSRYNEQQWGDS